ncbi:mORN repeat protein [Firmicutes bacterium CAG:94]|nr:mORN repeat protein [Firmicutes bacterium CAG:94]
MEPNVASSAMSLSLLARNVYCVCFADRDSLDILRGELALARERYFTGGCKTLRVGKREVIRGFEGKLQGKLSRRGFFWRKSVHNVTGTGNLLLEEAFDQKGGYLLVNRDFRNIIASRVFFNKALAWLKSEYYEPWDTHNARVIFKPVDSDDLVERFDWDAAKKRYRSTMLYPVPYLEGDAGQSLLNAQFGEPKLLVSTAEGMFCYCPKEEAQRRKEALADLRRGTLVILPAWEVKEGSLAAPGEPEGPDITFSSLEEYAHIQEPPVKDLPAMEAPEEETIVKAPVPGEEAAPAVPEEPAPQEEVEATVPEEAIVEAPVPGEEATSAVSEEPAPQEEMEATAPEEAAGERPLPEEAAPSGEAPAAQEERAQEPAPQAGPAEEPSPWEPQDAEDREILQAAREAAGVQTQGLSPANGPSYRGELREGLPWGQGRTEQPNGRTSYEGEFRAGKREGFGAYYYKNGSLCYAGSWKEDKKDGLGVSFRESDHILHIAKWKEGAPGEFVSLFDKEGNLRYGGRIEDGKKQGAGVSYNAADGTVFVGKWQDGQPTGIGSAFDREGNLAYYGAWKDGKRHGHGTEFDSAGAIVFDGEWRDGKYYNGILYQKKGPEDAAPSGEPSPAGELPNWDL